MTPELLLRALADGETHSGEDLARVLGVTRAAVWKQIRKLEQWGLQVQASPRIGYRLARRIDLLDPQCLRAALAKDVAARVARLEVFTELGSTNRHLLAQSAPPLGELHVCIAEYQTAGRGRRGRTWRTPLGGGLCLSAAWQFADLPPELSALTLAAGVVVRRAIERVSGVQIALKWPNDLVWDERKLGGILLELKAEAQGGCHVVTGIGLNVALPPQSLRRLSDWPRGAVDLAAATAGAPPARTLLAAALLEHLHELFRSYPTTGFSPYLAEWRAADYLEGRCVTIADSQGPRSGTALGIDSDGALLFETDAGARGRVISGDVSVRTA